MARSLPRICCRPNRFFLGRFGVRDQDGAEVVDVGEGGAGDNQVAEPGEKAVAVVVRQQRLGVEAGGGCACTTRRAAKRAGVVLAAVEAVGVAGEGVVTRESGRASCRERWGT